MTGCSDTVTWTSIGVAMLGGFAVVAIAGWPVILGLRKLSFRQHAYEDAPGTHAVKTGTPTMGGVLFAIALFVQLGAVLLFLLTSAAYPRPTIVAEYAGTLALIGLGLACGAIGFTDDLMSVLGGRNKGLSAKTKLALTAVAAAAFLFAVPQPAISAVVGLGSWAWPVPLWLWYALGFLAILATTHAVNLTDGLDGLASGTIVPPLVLFAWLGLRCSAGAGIASGGASVAAVLAGSALGFLLYNRYKAKVFMGDTGSLLLGGILAGTAIELGQQLLLILVGGVFVAETLSVIIQVSYFKRTKKRIFRMSPLHHHFELGGWPETKVTTRFWTASALLSVAGAVLAR